MLSSRDLRKQLLLLSDSSAKLVESLTSIISSSKASLSSQIFEESEKCGLASILFDSQDGLLSKTSLLDKVSDHAAPKSVKDCRSECIKLLTLALDYLPPLDDVPHFNFVSFCLEHLDSEDNYVRESILDSFSAVLIKAPGCFRCRDDIGNVIFERCNLLYSMQSFKSTPAIRGLCLRVLSQTILRFSCTRARSPQLRSHIKGLFDEIQARGIDPKHKARFIGALDALAFSASLLDVSEPFRVEALSILVKQLNTECTNQDTSRYDFMKSILNCIFRQSQWFGSLLLQREVSVLLDKYLTALCSHKNSDVRSCAFRAQKSFISEFSLQLSCSRNPDHQLLNLLVKNYIDILRSRESSKHVCLGLRSLGHLANPLSSLDPDQVKGIAQLFLDNGSMHLNAANIDSDETITTVPSLLEAFAQVLANLNSVDSSSRVFIARCSIMTFRLFPNVYPKLRFVFVWSLHQALMMLARHSDGLKHLIDEILFHGLLAFIGPSSAGLQFNVTDVRPQATQALLLSSLVSSSKFVGQEDDLPNDVDVNIDESELDEEVIKDCIRDAVMRQLLRIFEELNIGYMPTAVRLYDEIGNTGDDDFESDDDGALFGNENSLFTREGVVPSSVEDMSKFVRLSDLLGLIFESFPTCCLQKWLPSWIEAICSRIASYPLVTSLYSLLKHVFVSCQSDVLSCHEDSKHVILSLQLAAAEIFERSMQFRDTLFKTTLFCLLNAPAVALSSDIAVKILSRGLAIGLSDPKIAKCSMNSLSKWWEVMPEWTSSLSTLLPHVQFYITPSVSKKFSPDDVTALTAGKLKIKDPKKYESKVHKKVSVEQIDIEVVQLAIVTIGKYGPCAAHSLMHGQTEDTFENLHTMEWSLCEVEIPSRESSADPLSVNLDLIAPRAAFLALNGATRQIRANSAELFHAICSVLVVTLKASSLERHAKMIPRYLKICVKLASDEEQVCQKLFRPLVRQIVNFCIGSNHSQVLVPRILDVLFEVVVSAEDASQRQTASDVIAEFIGNAAKIYDLSNCDVSMLELGLRRVKAMLENPSASQRLSACEIVNNQSFYVPFREHPRQLSASVFCLYMIEGCLKCLKLSCRDDPVLDSFTAARLALYRFERLISNTSLFKDLQMPHPGRLGPPNITLSQFLSQYSSEICCHEKRYRDKIIRFFLKYGGMSSQIRSSCFNQEIITTCFQNLEDVFRGISVGLDVRGFYSLCASICAFYDSYQYFHSCDSNITLKSVGSVLDSLVAAIKFIVHHSGTLLSENAAVVMQSPRFIRSVKVQLTFVVYCTSKFLASHSFVRDDLCFVRASLRLCFSALMLPESLGLSISGGRTLKIDTPNQLIHAAKVSQTVNQHFKSEILLILQQSEQIFQAKEAITKALADLLLGLLLLDPSSTMIEHTMEPIQVQKILRQIMALEYSCSPRAVTFATSIVSGLSRSSKFAECIIDCICQIPREVDPGTSPPGALFFKRFSSRLANFIATHSHAFYSSLALLLSPTELKQAACVLELINDSFVAVKSVTILDTVDVFKFLQNAIIPLHLNVKSLSTSDFKMQHLCARFVARIFHLHPKLCNQISYEMSAFLFDILKSILDSQKPDKSVVNEIISSIFPYFLSPDSPLNVKVKAYVTDCFKNIGSLKTIQDLPPDDLRKLEANTTIMSIFDCISNSRWHGIIESVHCIYIENVALCDKLNTALSYLLSNLPSDELIHAHSNFIRLISSREGKSATQQYLRLQLCKNLWPLMLSACAEHVVVASDIHSSAWSFIGSTLQFVSNFREKEISSLDIAVDWLCTFQMIETAYRKLPKEKLFFRPQDMEQRKFSLDIMKSLAKARREVTVGPNVQLRFLPSLPKDLALASHNAFLAYICCTQSSEDVFNKNIFKCSSTLFNSLLNDLDIRFKVEIRFEIHKATLQNLQMRTASLQLRPQALQIHFSDASSMMLDASVVTSQSLLTQDAETETLKSRSSDSQYVAESNGDIEFDSFAQTGVLIPMVYALDTASRMFRELYSNMASNDEDFSKSWIADWIRVIGSHSEDPRIRLFYAKVIVLRPRFFEVYKYKQDFCAALCSCCELAMRQFHPDESSGPSFNYFVRDLCALLGNWFAVPISPTSNEMVPTGSAVMQKIDYDCLQGLINELIPICVFPKASIWKSNMGFIEIFARICSGYWHVNFDSIISMMAALSQNSASKRAGESFSVLDSSVMTFVHVIDLSLQFAHPQSSCSERCAGQFVSVFENLIKPQNEFNLSRKLREALFELVSIICHKLPHFDPRDMRLSIFSKAPQLLEISRRSLLHYSNSGRDDDHFICYLRKGAMFCPELLSSFKAQASVLVTKVQGDLRYCILETFQDYFKASQSSLEDNFEMLREIAPHFTFLLNSLDYKAQLLVFEVVYAAFFENPLISTSNGPEVVYLRSFLLSIMIENSIHVISKKPRLKMLEILASMHSSDTCSLSERQKIERIFKLDIASPHVPVQIAARKFWGDLCQSQKLNDRLEICVNQMFDSANCSSWLSSAVALLMQCLQDDSTVCITNNLRIKTQDFDLKAFPELSSATSDASSHSKLFACSFGADHSSLAHEGIRKSANFYTLTQGGGFFTQLNASQQGMDNLDASSMNTMDIFANNEAFVSVLKKTKTEQQSHKIQTLPLRFQGSDPDNARKAAIRLARKRTESLFQNVEDAKRISSEPEMLRRYRQDDTPDQDLSLSDVMKPLVASCLCDEIIASIMFCTLMKYQQNSGNLRGKKRNQDLCLFQLLQESTCIDSVHRILETATSKESSLVSCLIRCFLEHQSFCLSVETVVRTSIHCGVVRIGVAYLEGSIVQARELASHSGGRARKIDRLYEDTVEEKWNGLIKLYEDISDEDSLLAVFDMSEQHLEAKQAFSNEANGFFETALQFYASNTVAQQPHLHRGFVNCLQSLGRWDEAAIEFQRKSSENMNHCDRHHTALSNFLRADSAKLNIHANVSLTQANQFACNLECSDVNSWQLLRDSASVALLNFDTKEVAHTKLRIHEALNCSPKYVQQLVSCEATKGNRILSQLFRLIQVLESTEMLTSSKTSYQSIITLEKKWSNRLKNTACDFGFLSDVVASSRYLFLKLRDLRPGLGSQIIHSLSAFLSNMSMHVMNLGHSQYGMSLIREALCMVKEHGHHPSAEMLISYAHAVTHVEFMQRSSKVSLSSGSAVATVSQIKNLLSEFSTQKGASHDLAVQLILFRHLESLVTSEIANEEERTFRIHSAYHDLVLSLDNSNELPIGVSQRDICGTHQSIISWLSVQLSSSNDEEMGESSQNRDSFITQVIKSVSEIIRYSGDAGASYIPLAIQLAIESCAHNHFSSASVTFKKCAPLFQSGCCRWLSQVLAEYQSALLKNCRPICEPLEGLLMKICSINPQAMFFAVSCTIDSALVFLPAAEFKIVSDGLIAILHRIPNAMFYKRFVSELQSMVDPDQLWASVSKICQEMFNSNLQEQSFQYFNKNLERWNSVSHWKSQPFCRKFDSILSKVPFPVQKSNFVAAQSLLRSMKEVFQAPKVNAQGLTDISAYSTFISEYDGLRCPQKVIEFSTMCCNLESQIEIFRFKPDIWIAKSKTKPKKFTVVASDGMEYSYLCKGTEDLRQDQRVSQLFSISQKIMDRNAKCRSKQLKINYYSVYPLTIDFGIVEWMNSAASLASVVKAGFPTGSSDPSKALENCISLYMSTVLDNKVQNGEMLTAAVNKSISGELKVKMEKICASIPEDALRRGMHSAASSIMMFHQFRHEFSRTVAASSAVQWILGVGDRHAENNLLSKVNGGLLPIDFGIAFGDGVSRLPIPELMPFRLSPQMQSVFAPLHAKFILRRRMASVFSALKEKSSEILSLCEVFVKDRLLNIASLGNSRDSFQEEGALLENIRHDISALQLSLTQRPSLQKYMAIKAKLQCAYPGDQIVELLETNPHLDKQASVKSKLIEILQGYCHQDDRVLSPLECSDLILDMAMDFRLTGIAFRGWQAWI